MSAFHLGTGMSEVVCNMAQSMCMLIGQLKGKAVVMVVL